MQGLISKCYGRSYISQHRINQTILHPIFTSLLKPKCHSLRSQSNILNNIQQVNLTYEVSLGSKNVRSGFFAWNTISQTCKDTFLVPWRLSLSMKMCAQRKAGRRQRASWRFACRLYPSHGPLRFITSHSRFALASTMRKTKRLGRRLQRYLTRPDDGQAFKNRWIYSWNQLLAAEY